MLTSFFRRYYQDNRQHELFVYPSQPLDGDQIRILNIQPGFGDEQLSCTLQTVQRGPGVSYKALSYVWGDPTPADFVLVRDKAFWIHRNLKDALYRIRNNDHVVSVWTDAICINQNDNIEKSTQVQRIGQTYLQADEVLIWLGNAPATSQSLRAVSYVAHRIHNISQDEIRLRVAELHDVLIRDWYSRLWTLQEAVLAPQGTVLLGSEQCDLNTILELMQAWMPISRAVAHEYNDYGALVLNLINFDSLMDMKSGGRKFGLQTFWGLVLYCRSRHCQDPRDHIFGLVGLADQAGIGSEYVDYDRSTREVYQLFTEKMLRQNPEALIHADTGCTGPKCVDLPSWVPDFSKSPIADYFKDSFYTAGGSGEQLKLSDSSFSRAEGSMKLRGFDFDTIRAQYSFTSDPAGDLEAYRKDPNVSPMRRYGLMAEKFWSSHQPNTSPYGDEKCQNQAFWRTLVGGSYQRPSSTGGWRTQELAPSDIGFAYERIMGRAEVVPTWASESEIQYYENAAEAMGSSMANVISDRSVFLTTRGYLGIGPKGTDEHDIIVVIPGLRMPLILRKRPHGKKYQLVGITYVHGIMKGEFVESKSQHSNPELTTYVIE